MEQPVIEVTAVGRAWAVPDQVLVSVAAESRADAVADALRDASAAVDRLMGVLDELGIAAADRRTSGLRVEPVWDPNGGRETGHSASYELRVVVRDLAAASALVERAAEQVGDRLRIRHFALAVRDLAPHQELARARAVAACRAEAEQLAAAAGVRLGALLLLRTGSGSRTGDWGAERMVSLAGGMAVEPGEHEIAVAVTGIWQLVAEPG